MSGRRICLDCKHPIWEDATAEERASEPPRICSPLRCDAWKVVGRMTAPNPVTGGRTMLSLAPSPENTKES